MMGWRSLEPPRAKDSVGCVCRAVCVSSECSSCYLIEQTCGSRYECGLYRNVRVRGASLYHFALARRGRSLGVNKRAERRSETF